MSNKPKHSKTNITKISAKSTNDQPTSTKNPHNSDQNQPVAVPTEPTTPVAKPVSSKKSAKPEKSTKPTEINKKTINSTEKPLKEIFILARPFVAIGRYLRDSWREIRQVRWPNRKLTWKMTFAVLVYCIIFIVFIVLLDTFFTFIFNLLINAK